MTIPKNYSDPRGFVLQPFPDEILKKPLCDLHIGTIRPGCIRGNHYHPQADEWNFFYNARGTFHIENESGTEIMEITRDKPLLVRIPAGISHAVCNEDFCDMHLVSLRNIPDTTIRNILISEVTASEKNVYVHLDPEPVFFTAGGNLHQIRSAEIPVLINGVKSYQVHCDTGEYKLLYNLSDNSWECRICNSYSAPELKK